jgi:hypothetical protein
MSSDEEILDAIATSLSAAETMRKLGRATVGSNYRWIKRELSRLSPDTSHWNRNGRPRLIDTSDVFVANSDRSTASIKKLIKCRKLLPYICAICSLEPVWNNKPLILRLDHINGIRNDHRLVNLRFVCFNCDSQLDTFCGRNITQARIDTRKPKTYNYCGCGASINITSTRCRSCNAKKQATKIDWPSADELMLMISVSSYSAVGLQLGVSDVAVKKHILGAHRRNRTPEILD